MAVAVSAGATTCVLGIFEVDHFDARATLLDTFATTVAMVALGRIAGTNVHGVLDVALLHASRQRAHCHPQHSKLATDNPILPLTVCFS